MSETKRFVAQRRESVDTIEMESTHNALLIWQSNGIPEPADCISLSVPEARALRAYLDKVLPNE